jgi:hypothetical protein
MLSVIMLSVIMLNVVALFQANRGQGGGSKYQYLNENVPPGAFVYDAFNSKIIFLLLVRCQA